MNDYLDNILYVYILSHVYNPCNCCNSQHKCIALVMYKYVFYLFDCTFCWRKLNKPS